MYKIMASKKFNKAVLSDTLGPMNSVSKDDALAFVGVSNVKHLDNLNVETKREVLAKKRKLVTSTKKQERRISKDIIKNI
tara:strand:- start:466 stop:705 length:240 start_codon:yes stop_codon:yes gene_type:complete